MGTKEATTIPEAVAKIARSLGFDAMAEDVESGRVSPGSTIYALRKGNHSPEIQKKLERAQVLTGPAKIDTGRYIRTGERVLI